MKKENIWFYPETKISFASIFFFGTDKITIRTFIQIPDDPQMGTDYSEEEINLILKNHTDSFSEFRRQTPFRTLPASFFNAKNPDMKFIEMDVLTIERNSPMLGHFGNTDQCVYLCRVSDVGQIHYPFNRTAETMVGRLHKNYIYGDHVTRTLMSLKTDFAGMTWDDAQVVIKANPKFGYRAFNEDGEELFPQPIPDDIDTPHTYPKIVLTADETIAEDAYANVMVRCEMADGTLRTDCQSEVFLEAVAGYLPKTRVQLVDGVGSFKVGSLGLTSGDAVRVKAGWRYVPGLGDVSITVE